jgi:hypothetical protein
MRVGLGLPQNDSVVASAAGNAAAALWNRSIDGTTRRKRPIRARCEHVLELDHGSNFKCKPKRTNSYMVGVTMNGKLAMFKYNPFQLGGAINGPGNVASGVHKSGKRPLIH